MKKLMLAAVAALTLSMGVASAATVSANSNNHLPSPGYTYDIVGG